MAYKYGNRRYTKTSYRSRSSRRPRGALSSARYSKSSYRSQLNNDAVKQLKVVQYPHSTLTTSPKIPDGGESTSIGMRRHMFQSITLKAGAKFMECYLLPNSFTPLTIYHVAADMVTAVGTPDVFTAGLHNIATVSGIGTPNLTNIDTEIGRWRCVSLGLRIRNTNSDTGDNGSWQACRLQLNPSANAYNATLDASGKVTSIHPAHAVWNAYPPQDRMSDLPSFNSGLVKDIDKHYFKCLDVSTNDHEFNHLEDVKIQKATGNWAVSTTANIGEEANSNQTIQGILDLNVDGLKIVIAGTESVSAFIFDVVLNCEYVPVSNSNSVRFCDECSFAPETFRKVRNMERLKYSKA